MTGNALNFSASAESHADRAQTSFCYWSATTIFLWLVACTFYENFLSKTFLQDLETQKSGRGSLSNSHWLSTINDTEKNKHLWGLLFNSQSVLFWMSTGFFGSLFLSIIRCSLLRHLLFNTVLFTQSPTVLCMSWHLGVRKLRGLFHACVAQYPGCLANSNDYGCSKTNSLKTLSSSLLLSATKERSRNGWVKPGRTLMNPSRKETCSWETSPEGAGTVALQLNTYVVMFQCHGMLYSTLLTNTKNFSNSRI